MQWIVCLNQSLPLISCVKIINKFLLKTSNICIFGVKNCFFSHWTCSTGFKKSTSCRNLSGFSKRVRSNCYIRPEIKVLHQILKIWQRGDKNMLKILQKGWQTTSKRGDKHIKKTTSKRGDKKKSAEKKKWC